MKEVIELTDKQVEMIAVASAQAKAAEERVSLIVNTILAATDVDPEGAEFSFDGNAKTLTVTRPEEE